MHNTSHTPPPQAVILAAGSGSRLGPLGKGRPKCLQSIGDSTVIDIQIQTLRQLGVQKICVVVGHKQELILDHLKGQPDLTFIENKEYASTNSLYSMWLCRNWVRGAFVSLNADVLAHPNIYRSIFQSGKTAIGCDRSSGHQDEHMKVEVKEGLVKGMGKSMNPMKSWGENVGIVSYDDLGAKLVFEAANELLEQGGKNCWSPAGLDLLARENRLDISAEDITGLPWTEIDFPEDLEVARFQVWPRIISSVTPQLSKVAASV